MANGDLVTLIRRIIIDPDAPEDATLQINLATILPSTEFDIISSELIPLQGKFTADRLLLVVARDTT